jgi:primase-polymerase (primpol)-like protein
MTVQLTPNEIPIRLREHPQWICWRIQRRSGKETKVPIDPTTGDFASTTDATTWGTFKTALDRARRANVDGIGFVFTEGDPFVGVDLDDCRDAETGALDQTAIEVITRLHSYTEVSPSGTGLHIIARGTLPEGPRRRGNVEMYEESRYFTMTGMRVIATPSEVLDRLGALKTVHRSFVADNSTEAQASNHVETGTSNVATVHTVDDELVLQRARQASNGDKFVRLWRGDTAGYDSHSEADMALCCLLAFWTGSNISQTDRLFRRSGLMRPKWNEVHYADGATYGERTVERACSRVTEHYTPS